MKKIDSLQALKAFAFLGIFFIHSQFIINWAGIGVSTFFVLSGFLCEKKYGSTFDNTGIKHNINFAWQRIKKIYPLHIIIMLMWAGYKIITKPSIYNVIVTIAAMILNTTLTQSWIPNSNINVCLNGVAWFLSSITVLYFIFPKISTYVNNKKLNNKKLIVILMILLVLQVSSCWCLKTFFSVSTEFYTWFMYTSPLFRFVDFFAGMCLCRIIKNFQSDEKLTITWSVIEILTILITFLLYQSTKIAKINTLHSALYNGSTIYIIPSTIWVWLFYNKKGIITHLLSSKIFVFLGNYTPYLFLIHFPVTQFNGWLTRLTNSTYIITGVELILSILLSIAYVKIKPHITNILKTKCFNRSIS